MIDQDAIMASFVSVAQDTVGSLLSLTGPTDSPEPAVIKARQNGVTPDHPYIQVDLLNTTETDGYLTYSGVDENDEPYFDTHYKLLISYTVYGGNATDIARQLESYFRLDRVRDQIEEETTGTVEQTFQILSVPGDLATIKYEVASFSVSYNIIDTLVDADTGTITRIVNNGKLLIHEEDTNPLSLNIDESSIKHS